MFKGYIVVSNGLHWGYVEQGDLKNTDGIMQEQPKIKLKHHDEGEE